MSDIVLYMSPNHKFLAKAYDTQIIGYLVSGTMSETLQANEQTFLLSSTDHRPLRWWEEMGPSWLCYVCVTFCWAAAPKEPMTYTFTHGKISLSFFLLFLCPPPPNSVKFCQIMPYFAKFYHILTSRKKSSPEDHIPTTRRSRNFFMGESIGNQPLWAAALLSPSTVITISVLWC